MASINHQRENQSAQQIEAQLHPLVHQFLSEINIEQPLRGFTIDTSLERDLGLGSLEKAELMHRIEKSFGIQLPLSLLSEAKSLRDFVTAILEANLPEQFFTKEFTAIPEKTSIDPHKASNLIEVLINYAEKEPSRVHIYLQDEYGVDHPISYGQLFQKATKTAHGLINLGLGTKETVAIMLPTCEEFFYAFFGVLLAGGVPVPIYPPMRLDRIEEYAKREAKILRNAEVRVLITFKKAKTISRILKSFVPSLKAVTTVDQLMVDTLRLPTLSLKADHPALIQYTSGSTGTPKGVLLTKSCLRFNE